MKTLALNTFVAFENTIVPTSEEQIQNMITGLTRGLDDDLFLVLYTVAADNYIGFSILTPRSGDRTRSVTMAELALTHGADGALVYHLIISPRSLMHETRMMAEIDATMAEAGVNLMDYGFIRNGKVHSFVDVQI
jgi:hypothetical protein